MSEAATPTTAPSPSLLQRLKGLWQHRTLLGNVGLTLGVVFIALQGIEWICVRLGLLGGDPGNNPVLLFWAFLKNVGVVSGLSAFVWDALRPKALEPAPVTASAPGEAVPPAAKERGRKAIEFPFDEPGPFAALSFQQWFLTLTILFMTVLLVGIVTAFLTGGRSVIVTFPALAIIGGLLAWMNKIALQHSTFKSRVGLFVGASPIVLLMLWMLFLLPTGGFGGPASKWVLLAYGVVVFLPAYHLFEVVAPGTPPFPNKPGAWIAGAYLCGMALLGGVLQTYSPSVLSSNYQASEEERSILLGSWTEATENGDARIEFTRGGQAIVSEWNRIYDDADDYQYQFIDAVHLRLLGDYGGELGRVEILSKDEIIVKLHHENKKFVRPDGKQPTDLGGFIGKWVRAGEFGKTSAEFTKDGRAIIELYGDVLEPFACKGGGASEMKLRGRGRYDGGSAVLTGSDEMTLTLKPTRVFEEPKVLKLVRAKDGQQTPKPDESGLKDKRHALPPPETVEIDSKFVGTWELHIGNQKQGTITISKGGRYVYEGVRANRVGDNRFNLSGEVRPTQRETLFLRQPGIGVSQGEIEYLSETELLLTAQRFGDLPSGKLKRRTVD